MPGTVTEVFRSFGSARKYRPTERMRSSLRERVGKERTCRRPLRHHRQRSETDSARALLQCLNAERVGEDIVHLGRELIGGERMGEDGKAILTEAANAEVVEDDARIALAATCS